MGGIRNSQSRNEQKKLTQRWNLIHSSIKMVTAKNGNDLFSNGTEKNAIQLKNSSFSSIADGQ